MCALATIPRPQSSRPGKEENGWLSLHKPYYLKNDVVYTEDHVLVKKLILRNVAPALMPKHLKAHFMTFGRVERLQLFGGGGRGKGSGGKPKTKTGYVIFTDAVSAAKAMRRKVHHVNKDRLTVQPSDSWHQPEAYGLPETEKESEAMESSSEEPLASIFNLNDHCLEHIVRMLSARDRVRFARSCIRFRNIYRLVSPVLDKMVNFDIFLDMTLWDVRDFFLLSGRYIKHLEGIIPQRHSKRMCGFLGAYCVNLTTLNIRASKLIVKNLHGIFHAPHPLQNLQLRGCDLRNEALLTMKNLYHLKKLDLSKNEKLTGQYLDRLPNSIEVLSLTCCAGVQAKFLLKICKTLPLLRELHMRGVHGIGLAYKDLVFDVLEAITVSNGISIGFGYSVSNEYEHVAKLPALKKVVVHTNDEDKILRNELLTELVKYKSNQLEHFEARGQNCLNSDMFVNIGKLYNLRTLVLPHNDVIGERELELLCMLQNLEEINLKYCANVTDNALLRLVVGCTKLGVVHLQNCPSITEKVLLELVYKLTVQYRRKETQRTLPVIMNIHGSSIDRVCLAKPELAAKDIVYACFDAPNSSDLCYFDLSELLVFDNDDYFGDAMNLNFDRHSYLSQSDDEFDFFGDYEDYDDIRDSNDEDEDDDDDDEYDDEEYSDMEDFWD